jgi:hypothetical protein
VTLSVVQAAATVAGGTQTLTFPAATKAGSLLLLIFSGAGTTLSSPSIAVTDPANQVWSSAPTIPNSSVYWVANSASIASATVTNNSNWICLFLEISGAAHHGPYLAESSFAGSVSGDVVTLAPPNVAEASGLGFIEIVFSSALEPADPPGSPSVSSPWITYFNESLGWTGPGYNTSQLVAVDLGGTTAQAATWPSLTVTWPASGGGSTAALLAVDPLVLEPVVPVTAPQAVTLAATW